MEPEAEVHLAACQDKESGVEVTAVHLATTQELRAQVTMAQVTGTPIQAMVSQPMVQVEAGDTVPETVSGDSGTVMSTATATAAATAMAMASHSAMAATEPSAQALEDILDPRALVKDRHL